MKAFIDNVPTLSDSNEALNLADTVKPIDNQNDANDLNYGNYRVQGTLPANMPSDEAFGLLVCVYLAPNWLLQFYITLNVKIYKRAKINGTWSNWTN